MRIGIDARAALTTVDGIGRYALELINAFSRRNEDHEYVILKHPSLKYSFSHDVRFQERTLPLERFGLREQLQLPRILSNLRLDVFHSLHLTLPLFYNGVQVVTVHDIMPIILPYFFGEKRLRATLASRYFRILVPLTLKRAAIVITDSDNTSRDIRDRFDVHQDRIRKIYLGLDHIRRMTNEGHALPAKRLLPSPYIATTTNFRPYKNIPMLLRGYAIARREMPELRLVIMGENKKYLAEVRAQSPELFDDGVTLPGYVSDDEMRGVLASANAFVFPSLYEGFGLPILEAMAVGTPVITSNVDVLQEIGGDAPLYVDPRKPEELARAILSVCADAKLSQSMRERGLRRSAEFTWDTTARQTLAAYDAAMEFRRKESHENPPDK